MRGGDPETQYGVDGSMVPFMLWVSRCVVEFCGERGIDRYGSVFACLNVGGVFDDWLCVRFGVGDV